MRKAYIYPFIATLTLLVLSCSFSSAQNGLRYGISAGIQNTLLNSEMSSEIDVKNAICPLVTADIEYRFAPRIGLQSGLGYALYSQNTSKFRNNFNYLTLPVYLKVGGFKKDNRKFALSFFGGPNFKFLMSANNIYQDEKNDISDYTTEFHLDYTFGIGLNYRLNERLVLESHLTGTLWGSSFNNASFTGFVLKNFNYGAVIGFKYQFKHK